MPVSFQPGRPLGGDYHRQLFCPLFTLPSSGEYLRSVLILALAFQRLFTDLLCGGADGLSEDPKLPKPLFFFLQLRPLSSACVRSPRNNPPQLEKPLSPQLLPPRLWHSRLDPARSAFGGIPNDPHVALAFFDPRLTPVPFGLIFREDSHPPLLVPIFRELGAVFFDKEWFFSPLKQAAVSPVLFSACG